jgi:hypothetical protein
MTQKSAGNLVERECVEIREYSIVTLCPIVVPVKTGIQQVKKIPAYAGRTKESVVTPVNCIAPRELYCPP